jgi:hypothetical protein
MAAPLAALSNAALSRRFVARVSALPRATVDRFSSDDLRDALALLDAQSRRMLESRQVVSEILFRAVGTATDRLDRAALLRVRRDLFNTRRPRTQDLSRAYEFTSGPDREGISEAVASLDRSVAARARVEAAYFTTLAASRRHLADSLHEERFTSGVLAASPSLYRSFARYHRAAGSTLDAREAHIERGILRYFTRAVTKATPFASFCVIVEGRVGADDASPGLPADPGLYHLVGTVDEGPRIVRLNKLLFDVMWSHLTTRPETRSHLRVELNPTVQIVGDALLFLAALNGREVVQRLVRSDEIMLILDEVRRHEGRTLAEMSAAIAGSPAVDATHDDVSAYLTALVDGGLLRFRSPVRSQDADWISALRQEVRGIDGEFARVVVRFMDTAQVVLSAYPTASPESRAKLDRILRNEVDVVLGCVGRGSGSFGDPIVFEDRGASLRLDIPEGPENQECFEVLAEFVRRIHPLAYPRTEMAALRHFFDRRFPDPSATVPLLEVYETYYREHLNDHIERAERKRAGDTDPELTGYDLANPFGLPAVARIREVVREWNARVAARWADNPAAEEIDVDIDELPSVEPMNAGAGPIPRSAALFCQLARSARGTRIVLPEGRLTLGFGKYYSRFLSVLPKPFTEWVRRENAALGGNQLVELSDDANHNSNFHPPLLDQEILYPTASGGSSTAGVRWDDLQVERDPSDSTSLALRRRSTGTRVYPVDLGFLNPLRRPALFQFLLTFTLGGPVSIGLPLAPLGAAPDGAGRIVHRPRIVVGGHIVIARRSWAIPSTQFPRLPAAEPASDYFVRVHEWRTTLGMPAHVYVRVFPHTPPESPGPGAESGPAPSGTRPSASRESRDYRKPQFIDFESPMLVALFSRIYGRLADFSVRIEEEYPDVGQLPHLDGQPHAVELVMQVNWQEREGAS